MENVWSYPRPPSLEPASKPVRIVFAGRTVAATEAAFRVLETSHPPVYYLPPAAFTGCTLEPASGGSVCEWKGAARYWSIRAGERVAERASAQANFVAFTYLMTVRDVEQLGALHAELKTHSDVVMVL